MKKICLCLTFLVLATTSCNRTNNYIIPVDYEKYYEGVTSITEKEGRALDSIITMDWYNNTMGREIPDINVKDLNGETVKLKKWLKRETILVFTDTHCGFGMEEVEKEFPSTISNMADELEGIDILCLIEDAEDSEPNEVHDYAKSLQGSYNNIFIIDQKDALRMNLTGSPTKFYIDKDQVVRLFHMGFAMNQDQREENIRQGISLMKKEKQK